VNLSVKLHKVSIFIPHSKYIEYLMELREIAGLPSISNDFPTIREYDII
jgi:hypothetical protein